MAVLHKYVANVELKKAKKHNLCSQKYQIINSFTYNNKVQKPSVTVKDSKGKALKKGKDYTVTYPKDMKNVEKYTILLRFS